MPLLAEILTDQRNGETKIWAEDKILGTQESEGSLHKRNCKGTCYRGCPAVLTVRQEGHWKKICPSIKKGNRRGREVILHAGSKREWQSEEGWGVHLGKHAPSHFPPGVSGRPFGEKQTSWLYYWYWSYLLFSEHKLTINPKKHHGKRSFQKTSPKTVFATPRMWDWGS